MFDLAIVGGGPAGATLARLAGKSCRVLLLDQRALLNPFITGMHEKCCGGLLAPDAQNMLAHLGLGLPGSVLVGPQLFTVRTIDISSGEERYYQRHYINMDREKFDRYLISLIPSGVDIRCPCQVKEVVQGGDFPSLRFTCRGREYHEQARLIVGADGAGSLCSEAAMAGKPAPPRYLAIQEWCETTEMPPYFSVLFDLEITDFYCWTIPKENFLIVGAALAPGRSARRNFELLTGKLAQFGIIPGKRVKRRGAFVVRPLGTGHVNFGASSIALIGEAGGFISPTSAEGLSYAMKSASLLARSLHPLDGDIVKRFSILGSSLKKNIFLKNLKMPFMYSPFLRKLIMKSGLKSMVLH